MGISYVEQRGKNKVLESQNNRQEIEKWFTNHPLSTQKECGAALKLSLVTISKHFKAIRN